MSAEKILEVASAIPNLLATNKITKSRAAAALQFSRQSLHRKISNPSTWKVSELIVIYNLIGSK